MGHSMVALSEPAGFVEFQGLLASSGSLRQVIEEARRAAASELAVLLTGETGTGKDAMARAIHGASRRCGGPFVTIDCAALPAATLPGELFGHARGAFTGADRD